MITVEDKRLHGGVGNIAHGFFGRQGGASTGLYDSLNCALKSGDNLNSVGKNRSRVAAKLGAKDGLVTVSQVHSDKCVVIEQPFGAGDILPEADSLVTDRAGFAIGVLTADCAPILFTGQKADGSLVIGAAHSGWGGALKGIGEATIQQMLTLGAEMETIRAAIGPCIGPASYEVSIGFETPFLERDPADEHFFKEAQKAGHLMFDLAGYVANRLAQAGVRHVMITGNDTFAENDQFFSYRRTTHAGESDYGRQVSAISILS